MAIDPNDTYDFLFKIIIIGDSGCGKISIDFYYFFKTDLKILAKL